MATSMMKQRLIGAAVLIALGVIFIPMLLTGDGKFLSGEMESNVPPKPMYELEAPKVLPLDKRAGQPSDPVVETAPEATGADAEKTTPTTTSAEADKDSAKPVSESQQQVQQGAVAAKPESVAEKSDKKIGSNVNDASKSSADTGKSQTESKKVETTTTPSKPQATLKPQATSQPKTEASKPAPIVTGWAVQLGSFSVQKNALNLRDRLRKKGYASFVEEYKRNNKSSYRVRVGPELTRDLANELKTKLKAETKIDGFVVEFSGK